MQVNRGIFLAVLSSLFCYGQAALSETSNDLKLPATGQEVYETHCLVCHQANGGGVPYMQPALVNAPWVTGDPQALAVFVFSGGLNSAERKNSASHNVMPAFMQLGNDEMAAVLTYIRQNFGNNAGPVRTGEVARAREIVEAMQATGQ